MDKSAVTRIGSLRSVMNPSREDSIWVTLTGLAVFVFLMHGLWLINDVVTNEDYVFLSWMQAGDFKSIYENVSGSNTLLNVIPFCFVALFPNPLMAARIIVFIILVVSACCVRWVALEMNMFKTWEANALAVLSIAIPADMVWFMPSLISYPFYYCVFLISAVVALREAADGRARVIGEIGSLVAFYSSFTMASLLVYYGGFIIIHFIKKSGDRPLGFRGAFRYTLRYAHFLLLPIIFWTIHKLMEQLPGINTQYNAFVLNWTSLEQNGRNFVDHARATFLVPAAKAVVIAFALSIFWGTAHSFGKCRKTVPKCDAGSPFIVLAYATILFLSAIVPYVVVSKSPAGDLHHWFTRHAILTQLPAAIFIIGIAKLTEKILVRFGQGRKGLYLRPSAKVVVAACVVIFFQVRNDECLKYQAFGIEDRAFAGVVGSSEIARDARVFGVATDLANFGYAGKPDYVWPYFFEGIFKDGVHRVYVPQSFGYPLAHYSQPLTFESDFFFNQPPSADLTRQVALVITKAHNLRGPEWKWAVRYWAYKYFNPSGMPAFLNGILNVAIVPISLPPKS